MTNIEGMLEEAAPGVVALGYVVVYCLRGREDPDPEWGLYVEWPAAMRPDTRDMILRTILFAGDRAVPQPGDAPEAVSEWESLTERLHDADLRGFFGYGRVVEDEGGPVDVWAYADWGEDYEEDLSDHLTVTRLILNRWMEKAAQG